MAYLPLLVLLNIRIRNVECPSNTPVRRHHTRQVTVGQEDMVGFFRIPFITPAMCLDDHTPAMCMLLACIVIFKVRCSWDKACQTAQAGSVGFVCMQPWLSMSNDDDVFDDDDDDDEDDNGVKYALHPGQLYIEALPAVTLPTSGCTAVLMQCI